MTFEKYNANPENKNIGDCSIRAICTATPLTYQQAKKPGRNHQRRGSGGRRLADAEKAAGSLSRKHLYFAQDAFGCHL
jgi:hypothetical protein